jgi:hypothetical protein
MSAKIAACSPRVVNPNLENDLLISGAICSAVLHAATPGAQDAVEGTAAIICAAVIPNGLVLTPPLVVVAGVVVSGMDRAGARLEERKRRKVTADFMEYIVEGEERE